MVCSVFAYLKLGQHSLCTALGCKLSMCLITTTKGKTITWGHKALQHIIFVKLVWIHTWHVDHPAVTILQQVPGFTVNAAGGDTIGGEEFRVHRTRLAISPRRREVLKLKEWTAHVFFSVHQHTGLQWITQCKPSAEQKEGSKLTKPNTKVLNKIQMYLNENVHWHNIGTKCSVNNTIAHVQQQADIMQGITDAGLVPGRKQSTMGIETGLIEICKICSLRQDTTTNGQDLQPWKWNLKTIYRLQFPWEHKFNRYYTDHNTLLELLHSVV